MGSIIVVQGLYFAAMLLGIVAKEVWDHINETDQVGVRLPHLVGAIIVSPIVYAAVFSHLMQDPVSPVGLAIAFQNGFFWQAVFRMAQGRRNSGGEA